MLTEQEIKEIKENLDQYPQKKAASIETLMIVQKHRGWISDEILTELSKVLEMTEEELDNVATFYNLIFRRPVGKHVILVCNSVSCYIMKYTAILDRIYEELGIRYGETTTDQRFTLLPVPCLGACDHAPAMMIDNDLYTDLDSSGIAEILARYK